jgi:asparagine synthase (glutamine-hydrolysing)
MCGIAGLIKYKPGGIASEIEAMHDTFPYRGPDDKGSWIHPSRVVALGHRRLSILDTSFAGHQPMQDVENGLVIVFNGEIYNYVEIRDELKSKGHSFRTGTDTEVILKAFAEWGENCVQHFNGMFAFAIWQEKKQSLFIARDRLGIKPFYYLESKDGFYFASEIKAINAVIRESLPVEDELIDSYMSFGYVPGENTLLKGVKRLLPGHFMTKSVEALPTWPQKYWNLSFQSEDDKGEEYYLENARSLLDSAIDLRLRSDVPLGIFLSGGIDSSAVVGLLAPRVETPLKTFSVGYDFGKQYNEMPYARIVANKFNTDHHEVTITPDDFRDFIPQFIHLMDEPVTESAAISLYYVSKLAKNKVTVVLSGEGSDEIFGGYDLYQYMRVLEKYHKIGGKTLSALLANCAEKILPEGHKLAKYLLLGSLPLKQRYKGISTYEERYKKRLYNNDFTSICNQQKRRCADRFLENLFDETEGADVLSRMLNFDTKTWLVDDLLIKADRMSMAASLELRVPFLDYRLVEFAASMPSKYKIRNRQGKYLLKKMMTGILPKEIIYRKKMGFPTPLKLMFEGALYGYAQDVLLASSSKISAYFRRNRIEEVLREHKSNHTDHHRLIWQLIVLEQWLRVNQKKTGIS